MVGACGGSRWLEQVNVELTLEKRRGSEQEKGWLGIPDCRNSRYKSQEAGEGMAGSRRPERSLENQYEVSGLWL